MFGIWTRHRCFNVFMFEEEAVSLAESGKLVWYISKFNEPDDFTRSFD